MDDAIQLFCDGDGIAVIGEPAAVDQFMQDAGLSSTDLRLDRLRAGLGKAGLAARGGAEISANSGRWMKLTEHSAKIAKTHDLMTNPDTGVTYAVARANTARKRIKQPLQFLGGPRKLLNPATVNAIGAVMTQAAMQQAMDEIVDYLAVIDKKVDEVLRSQKVAVLADMLGVDMIIDEAMAIREHVGRVSDIAWSKVQVTPFIIARTQAYALQQLDALAEQAESQKDVGDLAKATKEAESKAQDWLTVLAECFRLQDAIAVLELDRVLGANPDEVNQHRLAVRAARDRRVEVIIQSTGNLLARMDAAGRVANARVLFNPVQTRAVVGSRNQVAGKIIDFQDRLGVRRERQALDVRRWVDAATDVRNKALRTGKAGVDATAGFVGHSLTGIGSAASKVTVDLVHRTRQRHKDDAHAQTPPDLTPVDPQLTDEHPLRP